MKRNTLRLVMIGCAVMVLLLALPSHAQDDVEIPTRDYWPTDDWQVCAPEEQGLDPELVDGFFTELEQYTAIDSLIIAYDGYIIGERYYNDYDEDALHILWSATKSVTSALVGIALDEGAISSLDDRFLDYFPEYRDADEIDPRKFDITIEHLLTMHTGQRSMRLGEPGAYATQEDWVEYSLFDLLQLHAPGHQWSYSSLDTHLLGITVSRAVGQSLADYAESVLWEPLGIKNVDWLTDNQGHNIGGSRLHMRPRDMAKFGYLYLNNGLWDEEQIIPAEWIAQSWTDQTRDLRLFPAGTTHYGYLWWIVHPDEYDVYFAAGAQGQYIVVIPQYDLVVVQTASRLRQAENTLFDTITEYLIPAIENSRSD